MKKLLSIILVLAMVLPLFPTVSLPVSAAPSSGGAVTATTLNSQDTATRAEAATLLMRYIALYTK